MNKEKCGRETKEYSTTSDIESVYCTELIKLYTRVSPSYGTKSSASSRDTKMASFNQVSDPLWMANPQGYVIGSMHQHNGHTYELTSLDGDDGAVFKSIELVFGSMAAATLTLQVSELLNTQHGPRIKGEVPLLLHGDQVKNHLFHKSNHIADQKLLSETYTIMIECVWTDLKLHYSLHSL